MTADEDVRRVVLSQTCLPPRRDKCPFPSEVRAYGSLVDLITLIAERVGRVWSAVVEEHERGRRQPRLIVSP